MPDDAVRNLNAIRMLRIRSIRAWQVVLTALLPLLALAGPVAAQTPSQTPRLPLDLEGYRETEPPASTAEMVDALMAHMTVADKVGQLFVVSFRGSSLEASGAIVRLVHDYRIGGVILSEDNGNIDNRPHVDTPRQVANLTNQLQALTYGFYASPYLVAEASDPRTPVWPHLNPLPPPLLESTVSVPLLLGVAQSSLDQFGPDLRHGFTPIPNQLAMGAAWEPEFAQAIGTILGQELKHVGVNLLLGPTLDILDPPPLPPTGMRASTAFGSDSWWIGQHGQAFIQGIHDGSGHRVMTFARHFPGQGGIDRRLDEELATIQGSMDDLRRHELLPFAQVTQGREDGPPVMGNTDGLLTSHIRYSGFLRSRERTPPISLSVHLSEMLALEEFAAWHGMGGLILSDQLGVRAIRTYYDPSEQAFLANRIASDAFMAGNDLLWLSQFEGAEGDGLGALAETILFFILQYNDKPDFAAAVDRAVRRILHAKLQLYPVTAYERDAWQAMATLDHPAVTQIQSRFAPNPAAAGPETESWWRLGIHPLDALVTEPQLAVFHPTQIRLKTAIVTQVAQQAVTLLHSSVEQGSDPRPAEPSVNDRLIIFTDSRLRSLCEICAPEPVLDPYLIEATILRLFGPDGTQQMSPSQIASFTFDELASVLDRTSGGPLRSRLERAVADANWILFAMLDVDREHSPESEAIRNFLRQRDGRALEKRIAVLSFDAPFMLDETDISKLEVYIGAYSPTIPFVESAVRALFRDLELRGAPPVNVPGTRFRSLIERLEPDPDQIIHLRLFDDKHSSLDLTELELVLEDTIGIRAGPILDRNGNPVPNGTPVQFLFRYPNDDLDLYTEPVPTVGGTADIEFTLDRLGTLEIGARSLDSATSRGLQIRIEAENPAQIIAVDPPTPPPPTPAAAPPSPAPPPASPIAQGWKLRLGSFAGLLGALAALWTGYLLWARSRMEPEMILRRLLWASLACLACYLVYGVDLLPITRSIAPVLFPILVVPVAFGFAVVMLAWFHIIES